MTDSNSPPKPAARYRDPPAEFRFKKGTSGNLKGRPRKSPALISTQFGGQPRIGFEGRLASMALKEAFRIITVREGDRFEKMTVLQGVLRKIFVDAVKGNRWSQKMLIEVVQGADSDRIAAKAELLNAAVQYKEKWEAHFADCDRKGIERPVPIPHPEEVKINYETGDVEITGYVMAEQKRARDQLIAFLPEFEENLETCAERLKLDPNDSEIRKAQAKITEIVGWLKKGAPPHR